MTGIRRRFNRVSLFVVAAGMCQTAVTHAESTIDAPTQQRIEIEYHRLDGHRSPPVAPLHTLAARALLTSAQVLTKGAAVSGRPPARRHYTAEESAALGAAADRRALERQRLWDRRLKQISGSICNGC
jgi:hypothetical protein